jgi:hypothetical protein
MALTAKLQKPLLGTYPQEPEFQNSEYEVHQVGRKEAGSQNFSSLGYGLGCRRGTNFAFGDGNGA